MDATITHKSLAQPWAGTLAVREYTLRAAHAHDYGQARVSIPRDHPLIADTAITDVRGLQVTIQQALLGPARYVQVGKAARTDRGWDLTCFELAYLLKLIRVPVRPAAYRNVPAGVLMRLALTAGLAGGSLPIYPGDFAEAAPYVEEYRFDGQSVDQVVQDLMALTGQEWEITEAGAFNWLARQGTLYETPLTEGYDCCVLSDFEPEDDPLGRVVVTDQRGYTTRPYVAREHAADLTARTLAIRADTVSSGATDQLAQALLNQGRVVRAVGKVGLYPQGGMITVTIPGPTSSGGFALMGGGFILMGGGFPLMGGGGGSGTLDLDYPTFAAPHWAIRPGDMIRLIAPSAGIRGRHSGLYRVRGITFGDGYLYPTLDLVQEPAWTAETLPVARRLTSLGASPPMTLERMILIPQQRRGTPIDAARLASPLEANQVPVLSALSGAATAAQLPDLDDLNGQIDPLTQANWTHDTSAPTATTTRYITVNLGGTDYKITAESVS